MVNVLERRAEIILCPECSGQGFIMELKRINAYESEEVQNTCFLCKGKRVLKKVTTIKYEEA